MTHTFSIPVSLAVFGLLVLPGMVAAQAIDDGSGEKLSPRADLEQVITETTYKSSEFLKAKKAFSGWPAKWSLDDGGNLVMPGDRVVPDGAPEAFLKAKKAFDDADGDLEFVMPGDNVSDGEPVFEEDEPSLVQ